MTLLCKSLPCNKLLVLASKMPLPKFYRVCPDFAWDQTEKNTKTGENYIYNAINMPLWNPPHVVHPHRPQNNPWHPQKLPWCPGAFAVVPCERFLYKFTFSS